MAVARWKPVPAAVICRGKTRWYSEDSAQRALTASRRRLPGVFDSSVRPYRCTASGKPHFHWGHGH